MKKRAENGKSFSKQICQNGQFWRGKNEIMVYFVFMDRRAIFNSCYAENDLKIWQLVEK